MGSAHSLALLLVALAAAAGGVARAGEPLAPAAPAATRPDPDAGGELLGTPAPSWEVTRWVRGGPLALDRLRGKVVLVRWWTEGCHFCAATLPGLEELRRRHAADGLVVVGMFHPKPPHDVSDAHILKRARELGFGGPIALDRDWRTLGR